MMMSELLLNASGEDTQALYSVLSAMADIGRYFRAYCYRSVEELGFSRNEIDVLLSLRENPEKNTVRDISENVHLSKGMISQAVEALRKKEFVRVYCDEKDHRSVLIHLTEAVLPVLNKLKEASSAFLKTMAKDIPEEQLNAVYDMMVRLNQNKEQMKAPSKKRLATTTGGARVAKNEA
jgi:DNA-binding MarR family transcriptional regulator